MAKTSTDEFIKAAIMKHVAKLVKERDDARADRDAARADHAAALADRAAAIDDLEDALIDRDDARADRDAALTDRDFMMDKLDDAMDKLAYAEDDLESARDTLADLRDSQDEVFALTRILGRADREIEGLCLDLRDADRDIKRLAGGSSIIASESGELLDCEESESDGVRSDEQPSRKRCRVVIDSD
jgi:chromosome segregation ATPase